MNDQLERDLLDSFEARAAAPVDASALAVVAAQRGRRLRVRLYAVRALSGVVALAVLGVGGVLAAGALRTDALPVGVAPSPSSKPPSDEETTPPPGGWKVPALPVAAGVPTAQQAPQQVGRDPRLVHFAVDGWASDSEFTTWVSREGSESVEFRKNRAGYEVSIAPNAAQLDAIRDWNTSGNGDTYQPGLPLNATPLPPPDKQRSVTVGGRPATLYSWSKADMFEWAFYVRWQPVDGLWAQVFATSDKSTTENALAVAAKVRVDQTYRCAAPLRVAHPPAGAKLELCKLTLYGDEKTDAHGTPTRLLNSVLILGSGKNVLRVESGAVREPTAGSEPNTEVGGRPARTFTSNPGEPALQVFDVDGLEVELIGGGSLTTLKTVASSLVVSGDGRDPATWPTPVIG